MDFPMMHPFRINYDSVASACKIETHESRVAHLSEELPYEWLDQYVVMSNRKVNAHRISENGFLYIYDYYSEFVVKNEADADPNVEDRLIGVLGSSNPTSSERNASRQRGWAGLSGKALGNKNDKGHFVAHSLGGGFEINMFVQLRDLNRGWSEKGKIYREMESYCSENPKTFMFSRPFYKDASARPSAFEFGILKTDGKIWLEYFEN